MADVRNFSRSRWAATSAAVAVTLGAGAGVGLVAATSSEPSSFVPITPERILDTRPGNDLGLTGSFVSTEGRDLQVTGNVPTPSGSTTVVADGATAVSLNVTAVSLNVTVVQPSAPGHLSVRPTGTPGTPETSNLNFEAGVITPNAVTVALSATGQIEITYDAFTAVGPTTDVLVDVLGYFVDGATGPQGPEGPQGPQGEPAPTALLPVALASIAADGEVRGGVGVGDVTMTTSPANRYVFELTDTTFGNDTHVAVVTPMVVDPPTIFPIDPCEQAHPSTSADAGKLVVSITTSLDYATCDFQLVVYRLP